MKRLRRWLHNRVWTRRILTRPCHGCDAEGFHDAHMTRFGFWWVGKVRPDDWESS